MQSLIRTTSLNHTKKFYPTVKSSIGHLLKQYNEGISILQLAKHAKFSPYLLARHVVEEVATLRGGKKIFSEAMRDPEVVLGDISVIAERFWPAEEAWKVEHQRKTRYVCNAENVHPLLFTRKISKSKILYA